MCVSLSEKYSIFKRIEALQRIIRWIALFEAVIGITAVIFKVILIGLKYESLEKDGTDLAAAREQLTKFVVLSIFTVQILFAFILHEGARKKILCMVKLWLAYCCLQLLIPMTMIFSNIFHLRNHQLPVMIWTMLFQIMLAIFHGIEATFVISFHKKTETDLRTRTLVSIEYHKNMESLGGIAARRKASDVSFSIDLDDASEEVDDYIASASTTTVRHNFI